MSLPAATDADTEAPRAVGPVPRETLATAVGALALAPVGAATALAVLRNAPVVLPAPVRAAAPLVGTLAALAPALALVVLGATAERPAERATLLLAGVFPLLAVADDAAWLPAAGALVAGGSVAVVLAVRERDAPALTGVAALGLAALALSLLPAAGVAPVGLGGVGAAAAFATLAALPLARSLDTPGLAMWVLVAVGVAWAAAGAPYVAGAVALVAFGAGDIPLLVLALGVGGAVAVAVAGLRRRRVGPPVAALLLLSAGAPASIQRATAVVLALVVLAATWDRGVAPSRGPPTGGETDAP